jgi:hypothetical protein
MSAISDLTSELEKLDNHLQQQPEQFNTRPLMRALTKLLETLQSDRLPNKGYNPMRDNPIKDNPIRADLAKTIAELKKKMQLEENNIPPAYYDMFE